MIKITPTLKEAKATAKRLGYQLRKTEDEFEVYPTGQRGNASYFTDCIVDALHTARAQSIDRFAVAVRNVAHPQFHQQHRQALIAWHARHLGEWRERLLDAWYRGGSYGLGFNGTNEASNLQRLRNTCGYEVLDLLTNV